MPVPRATAHVSLTESFAAKLLRSESVSEAVLRKASLCLIDYLACALESTELPWCQQAITAVSSDAAGTRGRSAAIIGTRIRTDLHSAVFANAVLGHGLVRDDMHLGSVSHLGTVIFPVLIGLSATRRVDGPRLLAAAVAGYEAGGRLGRAILDVEIARRHRPTGVTGPVAATAAGAWLLGFDTATLANAIALAANTVSGYNEWAATGGSEMHFHPGFAARNALTSLRLAEAGAFVSPTAIDGDAGLLAAYRKTANAHMLIDDREPEIASVFFKEVPACNFAQSPAQAARAVALEHAIDAAAIDSITARITYAAANYPGCDAPGPFAHRLQAKMSIQYNVAAALITTNFDESNYDPDGRTDIADLAPRVRLEIDAGLTANYPACQGAEIVVRMRDGREFDHRLREVEPASDMLVRARLKDAADARLGPRKSQTLIDFLDGLRERTQCRGLGELLQA
jgi:2-methylcitrate dehydratase PrpD